MTAWNKIPFSITTDLEKYYPAEEMSSFLACDHSVHFKGIHLINPNN